MKVTKRIYRALVLLDEFPGIKSQDFAKALWPRSPAWNHSNSVTGIYGAARTLLDRLVAAGYVLHPVFNSYHLTEEGRRQIELGSKRRKGDEAQAHLARREA